MDQSLEIEWTGIDRLFASPSNPRRNDAAVPHVAASLRRFGWRQPIVARPSGEVIAGNTRLRAAIELKMQSVPVVWFDGSDLDATAYAIADNRTREFAEWDEPALAKLLDELRSEDSLDGVGYSTSDIDVLLAELEEANTDATENPVEDPGAPHIHALVLDGVYTGLENGGEATFHPLPKPSDEDIEKLVRSLHGRVYGLLRRRGVLHADEYEELTALGLCQAAAVQGRIPFGKEAGGYDQREGRPT